MLAAGRGQEAQATAALESLCRTFWRPLYAHVRQRGYSPEEAQDLTQEFFARLLAKHWLSTADRRRGRFRSFLLAACDHFLANEWDRAQCQRRGGGQVSLPFDTQAAESLYESGRSKCLNTEEVFERNRMLGLLETAE